jgi:putative tryptophan/tyrosine transport system substrate-binding protein
MRRRDLVTLLGGAAALWPLTARAQHLPVVGFLSSDASEIRERRFRAFRQCLIESGFIEGRNIAFEYRFSEERFEKLPALAAELVNKGVALIFASPTPAANAAKAATKSIPIVFVVGVDPVQTGLVASLARPGGNLTGIANLNLASKRLKLLQELLPTTKSIGYLVNPTNNAFTESEARDPLRRDRPGCRRQPRQNGFSSSCAMSLQETPISRRSLSVQRASSRRLR